jgi:pyruvate dehydrogenase E2 component (dihydrolipoamide acetyltransferase)
VAKKQVTVPDIGGAASAEVIEVLVAVGDEVSIDQGLIVLESDKASMEIPSTVAGTVVELHVSEGQELAEGAPVAEIEEAAESAAPTDPEPAAEPAAKAEKAAAPAADDEEAAEKPEQETAEKPAQPAGTPDRSDGEVAPEASGEERTVSVPDIGTEEAVELIEVSVKAGDTVAEGDSLVVLESDKASLEVPAPFAGEVVEVLVSEGSSVRQGDALLVCRAVDAGASPEPEAPARPQPEAAGKPAGGEAESTGRPAPASVQATAPTPAASSGSSGPVYAGPAVRKLAREFGIDLERVRATGPRGRVLKEDLHRFVQESLSGRGATGGAVAGIPAVPEIDFSAYGPVEVVERSKLDKLTAANMHRSWLNVPHVTQFDTADITELEAFRASLKEEAERRGTKLTPMPFLLKACAVALRDNPKLSSSLVDGGERLALKQYCHLGMAVDTPAGLLVPVIRDVDRKTVWELAAEVLELAGRARERKLTPAEMQGGCFTVSSLGSIGGHGFTPIINTPEVGILGVSRAETRPVWDGDGFVPRTLLPLTLSYDHRVINGADGGRFLTRLAELLGDIRRFIM